MPRPRQPFRPRDLVLVPVGIVIVTAVSAVVVPPLLAFRAIRATLRRISRIGTCPVCGGPSESGICQSCWAQGMRD